ncbi:hypothetical protein EG68_04469 [Paragonimus skrjabini miyazakii]|uniref:DJ-1/PfpI domain-containing protein n=1 Tax=Paragonimus skrjabini miyazakii TaxID=59628 RepID=A0A8S9YYC1_9TREM|nr:hypothetical protein EG68_04469 [Paragonimus skrjabini miyazakii]
MIKVFSFFRICALLTFTSRAVVAQKTNVIIVLAPGFEELEAITVADVLKNSGANVTLAGLSGTFENFVLGAHGISLGIQTTLESHEPNYFDMIVFPGGPNGVKSMKKSNQLETFFRRYLSGSVGAGTL